VRSEASGAAHFSQCYVTFDASLAQRDGDHADCDELATSRQSPRQAA
jgi:hypothetical protein